TFVMLVLIAGIIAATLMKLWPLLRALDRDITLPELKLPQGRPNNQPFRVTQVVLCNNPLGRQGFYAGHLFGRPVFLPRKEDARVFDARDKLALRRVLDQLTDKNAADVFIVKVTVGGKEKP